MSNYNKIERSVARILSSSPQVKAFVKRLYSKYSYILNRKNYRYKCGFEITSCFESDHETFFGYYDKSPLSDSGVILACESLVSTKGKPNPNIPISILAISMEEKKCLARVRTNSYNWQQGARAHWLSPDEFIFNDYDKSAHRYVAKVYSIKDLDYVKVFGYAVQDSYEKEYFLSVNYRRIGTLSPDYGYRNLPLLSEVELSDLKNDGIWYVDYQTKESELLFSLDLICRTSFQHSVQDFYHSVNHITISPDGKKCVFLHRYFRKGVRYERLMLADIFERKVELLSDFGLVSHFCWVDAGCILGYLCGPNQKEAYWLIDIDTHDFIIFNSEEITKHGDGHPSVNGEFCVTDSYPDKARMQHLLLCNMESGSSYPLAELFHPHDYTGECRCDLHPRFSPDGKHIFFDSVFTGKRQLYRIEVS